jgi:hypothetical protein
VRGKEEETIMAVAIRKLAAEETVQAFPARQRQDLSEYLAALSQLSSGEIAAVADPDLSERALKRRLTLAAKQIGYRIKWSRFDADGEVVLRIESVPVSGTSWARANRSRKRRRAAVTG